MESRPLGRPKSITAIGQCPRPFLLSIMKHTLFLLTQNSPIFLPYTCIHLIFILEYFHVHSNTSASPRTLRAWAAAEENEVRSSQFT
jgi:hypothetical protein